MAKANPFRFSNKYQDDETDLLYYGYRYYNAITGRWVSRDPSGEVAGVFTSDGDASAYALLGNQPIAAIDYLGMWNADVHRDGTRRWAIAAGYPGIAANRVAEADNAVDEWFGPTSFVTEPGTQYHFNRSLSMGTSEDTRMIQYKKHLQTAQTFCTIAKGFDYPEFAAWQLGTALHPYQDWVAHGDHNYYLLGSFELKLEYRHNYMSPARKSYNFPDDTGLDAKGSPDGRPTLSVLHLVSRDGKTFDYADYERGQKRIRKTHSMTSAAFTEFRDYVKANGGCKCKRYFGVE
jgi:RHS repeat-associated protein